METKRAFFLVQTDPVNYSSTDGEKWISVDTVDQLYADATQ